MTVTVLFWSAIRIVYWLSHTPTLYGVLSLILPLSILPLLASAYAEVNFQGIQVFQVHFLRFKNLFEINSIRLSLEYHAYQG